MGDWTSYIHSRLSALEAHVFGPDQATAIADAAPAYDGSTEALTTSDTSPETQAIDVPPAADPAADVPDPAADVPPASSDVTPTTDQPPQ